MRSVPEWVAKHDDQRVPPRVRQRVFDRHNGICGLSNRQITPADKWEVDHIVALVLGGSHRESNLCPVLKEPHKEKTRRDVAVKSKIARVRKKHLGIKPRRTITRWRRFNGEVVIASRDR
jgi:5-methylcytosine-specific restriction protein A